MKNRDKFRDAIVKCAITTEMNANICEFIRINVLPHFGVKDCYSVNCAWCKLLLDLWLDEEYEEPQKHTVNWYHVPIDTLVRVRDSEDEEWTLQYFKCISEIIPTHRFETWDDGKTSQTTDGLIKRWKYCELVEVDDHE